MQFATTPDWLVKQFTNLPLLENEGKQNNSPPFQGGDRFAKRTASKPEVVSGVALKYSGFSPINLERYPMLHPANFYFPAGGAQV